MNSASARASSVLPTPVGPMNRKVPIGRFGSWSPARERRSAFETASTAASWPITRSCRRSSIWISFSTSPSISLETGMPVQLATTSATSSSSTSSLRKVTSACSSRRLASRSTASLLELGDLAIAQLGGALKVGVALGALGLAMGLLEALLRGADSLDRLLLALPVRLHLVRALAQVGQLALDRLAAGDRSVVLLLLQRLAARSRAAGCGARPRRSRWASSRSRCAAARPPRRSGRSPCRGGSGRRCSGARAWPRR